MFFQSLDDDGDPSKGIRITKESSEKLKLNSLDFKKEPVVFASDLQSTGAIPEGRAPVELEQALAHYHAQLLIGSWLQHEDVDYEEGEENSGKPFVPVLTFMPNNTYVLSVIDPNEEDQEDDEFCYSGFEVGSYTYSFDSLETVKIVRSKEAWLGSNTVCGMGDEDDTGDEQVHTLTAIDVNTMKLFRKDVKDYEETNVFNRIKNNGLKGTWLLDEEGTSTLSFLDGYYVVNKTVAEEGDDEVGVEFGKYTTDGKSFTVTNTIEHASMTKLDNHNDFGFHVYDGTAKTMQYVINDKGVLEFVVPGEGCFTAVRIEQMHLLETELKCEKLPQ